MLLSNNRQHWFTAERLAIYPKIVFFSFTAVSLYWLYASNGLIDPRGLPLGSDFVAFWAASYIGLDGRPESAYNLEIMSMVEVEKLAVPVKEASWAWFYPPTFYLVILPLSLLPYAAAYAVFVLPTFYLYLKILLRIVHGRIALWCIAAFPGIWIGFFHGQNGFLTAALASSALLSLPARPILSGLLIGLMAIKPHLALLFPLALIASGSWKAFFTAALATMLFLAVGLGVLGWETYQAFLSSLSQARVFMETGAVPLVKMPSYFALMRVLGASLFTAYIVHFSLALAAAVVVWKIWRKGGDWLLKSAALMTASFLVSPYVYDYDLVWLAFPIAWLTILGQRDGWMPFEIEVLVAAWLLPMIMPPIAAVFSIQIGPLVLSALLLVIWRRTAAGCWPN